MKQARQGHISQARKAFHAKLTGSILKTDKTGVPHNADKDNKTSIEIARGIAQRLGTLTYGKRTVGQTSGHLFEAACAEFVEATFLKLSHLRPGMFDVKQVAGRNRLALAGFEQYAHLVALDAASRKDPQLAAILGSDYTITPDVIVSRQPEEDEVINHPVRIVDDATACHASLRKRNNPLPILHASISCKWTIRSDRAQNARSEALNLVRNRKGKLPHVVIVTGKPLPSRIASLALGTGDIDCVYHFALPELRQTVKELGKDDALESLEIMVEGKRLRDISDLPLDLAV
jgi:NgoMIV restriction enzyme